MILIKLLTFLLMLLLSSLPALAAEPSITSLLEAVAKQPDIEASALGVRSAEIRLEQAHAELYPTLSAFGSYTSYSSPTNLRPMTPTEVNIAAGDSIPFSENITRYGLKAEMPLFVKGLYSLADKVKQLQKASKAGHRLRLITRQAAVVSLDASLAFTSHLEEAIAARLISLNKTRDDLQLAVNNGRVPESELLKVETTLNDLQKQRNDLQRQAITLTSQLEQLTGIRLHQFVTLSLKRKVVSGEFLRQTQKQASVAAAEKGLQQAWDEHYPRIKLEGFVSENAGEAYNTGSSIDRSYNYVGISVSLPLFNRSIGGSIDQAKVQLQREQRQLAQLRSDLRVEAQTLREQLPVIDRSTALAQTSLANNRRLLDIARVAYRSGRMTTEEYLRFETQVLDAEANLHKTYVDRWQIISQQAVLYGDELTGVVQ
jgi:outer membrane protein TolC